MFISQSKSSSCDVEGSPTASNNHLQRQQTTATTRSKRQQEEHEEAYTAYGRRSDNDPLGGDSGAIPAAAIASRENTTKNDAKKSPQEDHAGTSSSHAKRLRTLRGIIPSTSTSSATVITADRGSSSSRTTATAAMKDGLGFHQPPSGVPRGEEEEERIADQQHEHHAHRQHHPAACLGDGVESEDTRHPNPATHTGFSAFKARKKDVLASVLHEQYFVLDRGNEDSKRKGRDHGGGSSKRDSISTKQKSASTSFFSDDGLQHILQPSGLWFLDDHLEYDFLQEEFKRTFGRQIAINVAIVVIFLMLLTFNTRQFFQIIIVVVVPLCLLIIIATITLVRLVKSFARVRKEAVAIQRHQTVSSGATGERATTITDDPTNDDDYNVQLGSLPKPRYTSSSFGESFVGGDEDRDDVNMNYALNIQAWIHSCVRVYEFLCALFILAVGVSMSITMVELQGDCPLLVDSREEGKSGDHVRCPLRLWTFWFSLLPAPLIIGQPRFIWVAPMYIATFLQLAATISFHHTTQAGSGLLLAICFCFLLFLTCLKYIDEKQYRRRFVAQRILLEQVDELREKVEAFGEFLKTITPVSLQPRLNGAPNEIQVDLASEAVCVVTSIRNIVQFMQSMLPSDAVTSISRYNAHGDAKCTELGLHHVRTIGDRSYYVSNLFQEDTTASAEASLNAIRFAQLFGVNKRDATLGGMELTTGIALGSMSGMPVGLTCIRYDVFGEVVESAEVLCANCEPNGIRGSGVVWGPFADQLLFVDGTEAESSQTNNVDQQRVGVLSMTEEECLATEAKGNGVVADATPNGGRESERLNRAAGSSAGAGPHTAKSSVFTIDATSINTLESESGLAALNSVLWERFGHLPPRNIVGVDKAKIRDRTKTGGDGSTNSGAFVRIGGSASDTQQQQQEHHNHSDNGRSTASMLMNPFHPLARMAHTENVANEQQLRSVLRLVDEGSSLNPETQHNLDLSMAPPPCCCPCLAELRFEDDRVQQASATLRALHSRNSFKLMIIFMVTVHVLMVASVLEERWDSMELPVIIFFVVTACCALAFVAISVVWMSSFSQQPSSFANHEGREEEEDHQPRKTPFGGKPQLMLVVVCGVSLIVCNFSRPSAVGDDPGFLMWCLLIIVLYLGSSLRAQTAFYVFVLVVYHVGLFAFRPVIARGPPAFTIPIAATFLFAGVLRTRHDNRHFATLVRIHESKRLIALHDDVQSATLNAIIPRPVLPKLRTLRQGRFMWWSQDDSVVINIKFMMVSPTPPPPPSSRSAEGVASSPMSKMLNTTASSTGSGGGGVAGGTMYSMSTGSDRPASPTAQSLSSATNLDPVSFRETIDATTGMLEDLVEHHVPNKTLTIVQIFGDTAIVVGPLVRKKRKSNKGMARPPPAVSPSSPEMVVRAPGGGGGSDHLQDSVEDAMHLLVGLLLKQQQQQERRPSSGEASSSNTVKFTACACYEQVFHMLRMSSYPSYEVLGPGINMAKGLAAAAPAPLVFVTAPLAELYQRECDQTLLPQLGMTTSGGVATEQPARCQQQQKQQLVITAAERWRIHSLGSRNVCRVYLSSGQQADGTGGAAAESSEVASKEST